MSYRSRKESSGGCLKKGCTCAVVVFVVIPLGGLLLLFLLAPKKVERFNSQKFAEDPVAEIERSWQEPPPPPPPVEVEGERSVSAGPVTVRYQCRDRNSGEHPFVEGYIDNRGQTPVNRLVLQIRIPAADGAVYNESFEVIKNIPLEPGGSKRFVLHPTSSPPDWTPGRVALAIEELSR